MWETQSILMTFHHIFQIIQINADNYSPKRVQSMSDHCPPPTNSTSKAKWKVSFIFCYITFRWVRNSIGTTLSLLGREWKTGHDMWTPIWIQFWVYLSSSRELSRVICIKCTREITQYNSVTVRETQDKLLKQRTPTEKPHNKSRKYFGKRAPSIQIWGSFFPSPCICRGRKNKVP